MSMKRKAHNELRALISLLDEPDNMVYKEICNKIMTFGRPALPLLENAWESTLDPFIQKRIENLSHKIQFISVQDELKEWLDLGASNLLLAYCLVTRSQYPNLDEETVKKELNIIKQDIWLELSDDLTALEKIKVVNHIFFDIYQFKGNKTDYYAPQNSYINKVLETKKGNPLSLGMIYIILCEQLNIPVYGVNLPEHFVLAYTNELNSERISFIDRNEVLFYINPFNKGVLFTRKEVEVFLERGNYQPGDAYFYPCSNVIIIKRLIANLINSYDKLGLPGKINELKILLSLFD